ncbi:hypothetical protein MMC28_004528 [Mycoblastus sanguinarius]|nr:hypothetical protein [Mycoblastus sanguinarius]
MLFVPSLSLFFLVLLSTTFALPSKKTTDKQRDITTHFKAVFLRTPVNATDSLVHSTVKCYNPHSRALRPVPDSQDCQDAIARIYDTPDAQLRQLWHGEVVPAVIRSWSQNTCCVSFQPENQRSLDTFSMIDVASSAKQIAQECVGGQQHNLGGAYAVGSRGMFIVSVQWRYMLLESGGNMNPVSNLDSHLSSTR